MLHSIIPQSAWMFQREIEAMLGAPICERFDLIYGTSTGAIIATLLALGHRVEEIHDLYRKYVPKIMQAQGPADRSRALSTLGKEVFGEKSFLDVKTGIGVVATKWVIERPMIFKNLKNQAHGRTASFKPGFGVSIADAVQASCSAYPFFDRKTVTTSDGDAIELIDGGYCANNPTLYAIADAVGPMGLPRQKLRVVNVGVGVYPEPKARTLAMWAARKYLLSVQLLQKTLEINTQSMDQLREILFKDVQTVRISDTFQQPEMATDLLEHNLAKLNVLRQRGAESFASRETALRLLLL
jgi:patatin-like phospholipase/acyl hydrolase